MRSTRDIWSGVRAGIVGADTVDISFSRASLGRSNRVRKYVPG
jgi:hypothetical protein